MVTTLVRVFILVPVKQNFYKTGKTEIGDKGKSKCGCICQMSLCFIFHRLSGQTPYCTAPSIVEIEAALKISSIPLTLQHECFILQPVEFMREYEETEKCRQRNGYRKAGSEGFGS